MIVPGSPKFISGPSALQVGHNYSISSGVGGSFRLEYMGLFDGLHRFKNLSGDWAKSMPLFNVEADKLTSTIYFTVPTESWAAKQQAEWKKARGIHDEHEADCKACKHNNALHIEFTGPEGDTATVIFPPVSNTTPIGFYLSANSAPPDHPRRVELPTLAKQISEWAGLDLHWNLMDDSRRYWSPCLLGGADLAYKAIASNGFKAHGEEQVWLETGEWPK